MIRDINEIIVDTACPPLPQWLAVPAVGRQKRQHQPSLEIQERYSQLSFSNLEVKV